MLKNVLFTLICLLLSQTLYADSDKDQLKTLPKDASIGSLPKDGSINNLPKDGSISTLPKDDSINNLPENIFAGLDSLKSLKFCLWHLLSEEQVTTVVEYNHAMHEAAAKLDALALDQDQYLEDFVSEHTFENCLHSIKDTMMNPNSTKDEALEVATCFNIDDFSTPNERVEVETHIIADMKEQLSNILTLVTQRVEMAYNTSSFEEREAVITCTEYFDLW